MEQNTLIRNEPIKFTLVDVPLSQLPPYSQLLGDDPTDDMIDSVKALGVFQPVGLAKDDDGRYRVAWGRRRIKAALKANLRLIPALVAEVGTANLRQLALLENHMRKPNPVSDYVALKSLLDDHTLFDVQNATGFTKAKIASILRLGNLLPVLMDAAKDGRMSASAAKSTAGKTKSVQQRLVAVLKETGRIRVVDVTAATKVGAVDAGLIERLFSTPDAPVQADDVPLSPWNLQVAKKLEEAIALCEDDDLAASLSSTIDMLVGGNPFPSFFRPNPKASAIEKHQGLALAA